MIDVVSGTNGTLDGSSAGHPLTNKGLFVVSAGATANIAGTIVNNSTISVGGNGSGGVLRVALGGASLQGNGKVILSDFGSGSIQMITSGGSGGTPKVPKPWMVLLRFVRGDGSGSPVI
jgi:hypothetical protein